MIKIIKASDNPDVRDFLKQEGLPCLNALNYLDYDKDALAFVYGDDPSHGVAVCDVDQHSFYVAAKSRQVIEEFWQSLPFGFKMFSGVPEETADMLFALEGVNLNPLWRSPCKTYVFTGAAPADDSGYADEALNPDDAEMVDEFYTYRGDWSLEHLRECIKVRDSSCIRIDGELAAWCLVHAEDGSLGPLYVKEEYRRRGLGQLVSGRLIKKLLAKGQTPYAHVVDSNAASLGLVANMPGFEFTHNCVFFGTKKEDLS